MLRSEVPRNSVCQRMAVTIGLPVFDAVEILPTHPVTVAARTETFTVEQCR